MGLRKTILFLCLWLLLCPNLLFAGNDVDSLFAVFNGMQSGNERIEVANKLRSIFIEGDYIDSVPAYSASDAAESIELSLHGDMATFLYEEGRYDDALPIIQKAISLSESIKDSLQLTDNYSLMGICYQRMGNYDDALVCANKCLEIETKLEDEDRLCSTYNSLAALYMQNERLDIAAACAQKSVELARDLDDDRCLAIRLGMLSDVRLKQGQKDDALEAINEALDLDRKAGREEKVAIRLSQKADVLYSMQKWHEAEKYCLEAYDVFDRNDNKVSKAICLRQLGAISVQLGNPGRAERYTLQCLEVCKELGNKFLEQKAYKQLYDLDREANPAKALGYYENYVALKDSIFSERVKNQLADFEVKYDTREKEHQIELKNLTIKRQQDWGIVVVICALLFLMLAALLFAYGRLTRRKNRELTEINALKNKFFSIISHDLKNPVLAQKRTLTNLSENLSALSSEEVEFTVKLLLESVTAQSDLLNNLLLWARIQTNRMEMAQISFNVSEVVEQIISLAQLQIDNKQISIEKDLCPDAICMADKNMVATIVRNLLSNAIKFTPVGGKITLKACCENGKCVIVVADNGVGMSPQMQQRLFRIDEHHTSAGTEGEQGTGLGLIVCQEMVQKNNGSISVESEQNKGTTFTIVLNQ